MSMWYVIAIGSLYRVCVGADWFSLVVTQTSTSHYLQFTYVCQSFLWRIQLFEVLSLLGSQLLIFISFHCQHCKSQYFLARIWVTYPLLYMLHTARASSDVWVTYPLLYMLCTAHLSSNVRVTYPLLYTARVSTNVSSLPNNFENSLVLNSN